jgi:hypothetical protein
MVPFDNNKYSVSSRAVGRPGRKARYAASGRSFDDLADEGEARSR